MPAHDLANAVVSLGARILVIGSTAANETRLVKPLATYIQDLLNVFAQHQYEPVSIWIGGPSSFSSKTETGSVSVSHARSLTDFDSKLTSFQEA
jgi:hypothetical protein